MTDKGQGLIMQQSLLEPLAETSLNKIKRKGESIKKALSPLF